MAHTVIKILFAGAMLAGALSLLAHFYVLAALKKQRVAINWVRRGLPGYLTRLCRELPPSPENLRLAQLSRLSDITMCLAFLVGVVTGQLMAGSERAGGA